MIRTVVVAAAVVLAACGGESLNIDTLADAPILHAEIAGLTNGRVTQRDGGERASITRLYEVAGSWEDASVSLAAAVSAHGWQIQSVNCVGTGNDVTAKRRIGGIWILLESGAGTRGAGIILSVDTDQAPPGPFAVTGSCTQALIESAGS